MERSTGSGTARIAVGVGDTHEMHLGRRNVLPAALDLQGKEGVWLWALECPHHFAHSSAGRIALR